MEGHQGSHAARWQPQSKMQSLSFRRQRSAQQLRPLLCHVAHQQPRERCGTGCEARACGSHTPLGPCAAGGAWPQASRPRQAARLAGGSCLRDAMAPAGQLEQPDELGRLLRHRALLLLSALHSQLLQVVGEHLAGGGRGAGRARGRGV